jgi:non-ribosomal peptide synthetase component F
MMNSFKYFHYFFWHNIEAKMTLKLASAHPMTGLQESLFALASAPLSPGQNPPYVEQFSTTIAGTVDVPTLAQAWCDLTKRHASLRTVFTVANDGRRVQAVLENRDPHIEILGHSDIDRIRDREQRTRFDFKQDPLLRVKLITQNSGDLVMIVTFHHLIMDAFSAPLMIDELMALYAFGIGVGAPMNARPAAHPGTLADLQNARRGPAGQAYWRHALEGATVPKLPIIDRNQPHGEQGKISKRLPPSVAAKLTSTAQALGIGKSTVLLAVWGVVLARVTDQDNIVFASVMANRGHDLAGIESAIGLFAATLPLRVDLTGQQTFAGLCHVIQEQSHAASMWSAMPLADIIATAGLNSTGVDHTMIGRPETLAWGNEELLQFPQSGLTLKDYHANSWDHYDFQIGFTLGQAPFVEARHDKTRCLAQRVDGLLDLTCDLLQRLLEEPHTPIMQLPICSNTIAQSRLQSPPRDTVETIAQMLEGISSEHMILADVHGALNVKNVETAVVKIAETLRQQGVVSGDRVAINASQDRDFTLNALACWRCGASFVPVDERWPNARQKSVIEAAMPKALLGLDVFAAAAQPANDDEKLAYIIFTSGTTGRPKGVAVRHTSLANYCNSAAQTLGLTASDRALQVTSPAFDLGYTTAFGLLAVGGACHWIGAVAAVDPNRILQEMSDRKITVVKTTPSFLRLLLSAPDPQQFKGLAAWRLLILGGERPDHDVLSALAKLCPQLQVAMHYGPAEATIGCTMGPPCDIKTLLKLPLNGIGSPVDGTEIRIIAQNGMTMPVGIRGEIAIGGACLASGYLEKSQDDRFTTLDGQSFFRSGDMGLIDHQEALYFEGRIGNIFKIRGQRVDPEETRIALLGIQSITDAAVCVRDTDSGPEMVAFVAVKDSNRDVSRLRKQLSISLLDVQIPQQFIFLSQLLLTGSGKADLMTMSASIEHAPQAIYKSQPPETPVEKSLATLWQDVLGAEFVGRDDDFYVLGGHSLRALEIASRYKKLHGEWLPLRWFNDYPKLADIAAQIDRLGRHNETPQSAVIRLWDKPGSARMLCLPGPMGGSSIYREWLGLLAPDHAVDGIDESMAFDACTDMTGAAKWVLREIGEKIADYRVLIGWSFGADLAHAIADQLRATHHAPNIVLIDRIPGQIIDEKERQSPLTKRRYWSNIMKVFKETLGIEEIKRKEDQFHNRHKMQINYDATLLDNNAMTAVLTSTTSDALGPTTQLQSGISIIPSGGDNFSLFHPPHVTEWTAQLRLVLADAIAEDILKEKL